ncbi:hypothetical protein ABZP36_016918 [Zizania latifolia]
MEKSEDLAWRQSRSKESKYRLCMTTMYKICPVSEVFVLSSYVTGTLADNVVQVVFSSEC